MKSPELTLDNNDYYTLLPVIRVDQIIVFIKSLIGISIYLALNRFPS